VFFHIPPEGDGERHLLAGARQLCFGRFVVVLGDQRFDGCIVAVGGLHVLNELLFVVVAIRVLLCRGGGAKRQQHGERGDSGADFTQHPSTDPPCRCCRRSFPRTRPCSGGW